MYQLKEGFLAARGNVRGGLVRERPLDEPRAPRGETELVRCPLVLFVVVVGACALSEQTRDDVRGERCAQGALMRAHSEALKKRRPYREEGRRWVVRVCFQQRRTFPMYRLSCSACARIDKTPFERERERLPTCA